MVRAKGKGLFSPSTYPSYLALLTEKPPTSSVEVWDVFGEGLIKQPKLDPVIMHNIETRPCEQGNWDTWMDLDPWNQV